MTTTKGDLTRAMRGLLPLKDMDATMLALAIQQEVRRPVDYTSRYEVPISPREYETLKEAIALAAHIHHGDTRVTATRDSQGRHQQPTSPYIEHPLRNTLRLIRWGVRDVNVLIAELFHDAVEDQPKLLVSHLTDEVIEDKTAERLIALSALASLFNTEVSKIVDGMSNPIIPAAQKRLMSVEQKNTIYAEHVREAITEDIRVFLCKLADLVDNALSLAHSFELGDESARRRATKYRPVMAIISSTLEDFYGAEALLEYISPQGIQDIRERLVRADEFLLTYIEA